MRVMVLGSESAVKQARSWAALSEHEVLTPDLQAVMRSALGGDPTTPHICNDMDRLVRDLEECDALVIADGLRLPEFSFMVGWCASCDQPLYYVAAASATGIHTPAIFLTYGEDCPDVLSALEMAADDMLASEGVANAFDDLLFGTQEETIPHGSRHPVPSVN